VSSTLVIDAHAHCGVQDSFPPQDFEAYRAAASGSDIRTVVMFPPVAEIYDRDDPDFEDTPWWRERRRAANEYLLHLGDEKLAVIPYFFIWNDFAVEQMTPQHQGVKWHRHPDEPRYRYDDPRCAAAVSEIRRRNLPVVLEEELDNTLRFLEEWAPGVRVVIPHLGALNGGYEALRRRDAWERENVWADTALAGPGTIRDYVRRFGPSRLLFGSDYPFGDPVGELEKVRRLGLPSEEEAAVLGGNLKRLLAGNRP